MNRWNEYCDRVSAQRSAKVNKTVEHGVTPVKSFSVFPQKLKQRNQASVDSNIPMGTYSRKEDVPTVSQKVQNPQNDSNFAWVD